MMDELQTARTLLAQTCGVLKVFPLPGAVVLPGTPAPFHVFEPRYRAMTADALAGDRLLAVATLIAELANGKPYREFRAEILDDVWPAGGAAALEGARAALDQLVLELAQLLPPESGAPQLAAIAARPPSASALADLVAAAVVSEPERPVD